MKRLPLRTIQRFHEARCAELMRSKQRRGAAREAQKAKQLAVVIQLRRECKEHRT